MKDLIERHKELYQDVIKVSAEFDRLQKELADNELAIKIKMSEQQMSTFTAENHGKFTCEEKTFFSVKADNKDEMLAWFKADPELKNLVKMKEEVHYKTQEKIYRDMYESTNTVPPFVVVSPVTQIAFKPAK